MRVTPGGAVKPIRDWIAGSALVLAWGDRLMLRMTQLPRYPKRAILAINDLVIQGIALWVGVSVRYGQFFIPPSWDLVLTLCIAPVIGVLTLFGFNFYRNVTRFMGGRTINVVALAMCLSALIWTFFIFMTSVQGVPRWALVVYVIVSTFGIWGSRQIAGSLLRRTTGGFIPKSEFSRSPVVVYGAGQAALALARSLEWSDRYFVVGLVDRSPSLWGQYVGGYKVYRPDRVQALIDRRSIKEVLVALDSSVPRSERTSVLLEIESYGVPVRKLPDMADLATGKITATDLRPVEANDLLGRDPVPPDVTLMSKVVTGKTVMVTGAGGSIGSELCRQLWPLGPIRMILLEISETALFEIHQQLSDRLAAARIQSHRAGLPLPMVEFVMVLGSIGDNALVREVLHKYDVGAIYHAAAYKHVPILESNIAKGIENNTFGTVTLARAALDAGVERFVLVSTDKAVRPTNIMGASKRLAEMTLQALTAANPTAKTIFTIVRFGNVLDSSGSVVRRFRQQIASGGPVTVTHPDMIRYFMSIPEAASLVIQAGAMASGGEVFVLDMGEPVRIDSLARSMIQLAGLKVRDAAQPDGDISIEYIGLRPGEKLREELLIGSDARGTEHPRIQQSIEPFLTDQQLTTELDLLKAALATGQVTPVHDCLKRTVEGYRPSHDTPALAEDDSQRYSWSDIGTRTLH